MLKLITKIYAAQRFSRDESGATMIEYGLIAGLISVVAITILITTGEGLLARFTAVSNALAP